MNFLLQICTANVSAMCKYTYIHSVMAVWLVPCCSQHNHAEPGDETPATEIQSGQSSTIPRNPLTRRREPQSSVAAHALTHWRWTIR